MEVVLEVTQCSYSVYLVALFFKKCSEEVNWRQNPDRTKTGWKCTPTERRERDPKISRNPAGSMISEKMEIHTPRPISLQIFMSPYGNSTGVTGALRKTRVLGIF